jgi:DNA-binding CsgD family transcriptional regulator
MAERRDPTGGEGQVERWPLVGRADELALAQRALAAGQSVVLTGAAGVGKTRLARELLSDAGLDAERVVWIAAIDAGSQIPLGAVAHLIVPDVPVGAEQTTVLQRSAAALARRVGDERLLVGVDDAHLLDGASAAFVHLLATSGVASVVVTFRSGQAVPDPITALWKDAGAPLVTLQPLARPEVDSLVSAALGGLVDGRTVEMLWRACAGNALFLHELVLLGVDSGALQLAGGLWRWRGDLQPGERLTQLVARRIGRLTRAEQQALELIAVGEPLTRRCVGRLDITRECERLARRGVVDTGDDVRREVRLAHPLFGEVVRAGIPAVRLDEVRLRLADAFEAELEAGDDASRFRVALWRAQSDDASRPDELCWAARHALRLWDGPVAEQLALVALRAGPDLERVYLHAEALRNVKRGEEAAAAYARTEALPGPESLRAQVAFGWSNTLTQLLDRRDEARAMLLRTLERLTEPAARQRVLGTLLSDGLASVDEIAPQLDDELDPGASFGVALDSLLRGHTGDALDRVEAALTTESAWAADLSVMSLLLRLVKIWALAVAGQPIDAEVLVASLYRDALQSGADYPRGAWCLAGGMVTGLRGAFGDARRSLLEASAALEHLDPNLLRAVYAHLAMACSATPGRLAEAEHALDLAEHASRVLDRVFGPEVERAGAWVEAARGNVSAARRRAREAADMHRAGSAFALEALALHDAARFGEPAPVARRIVEIAKRSDGLLLSALADHVRALTSNDGPELLAVARRFAAMGCALFAAEAATAAAAVLREHGLRAQAATARELAAQLTLEIVPVSTPALQTAEGDRYLTAREREVAALAANGLGSRDIASRLGITTRTVDNLLGRVYVKLGVRGRDELSDALATAIAT